MTFAENGVNRGNRKFTAMDTGHETTLSCSAGVTRDRLYTRANWGDREFVVVDTGGLMSEAAKLPEAQQSAAMRAISDHELPQVCLSTLRPTAAVNRALRVLVS